MLLKGNYTIEHIRELHEVYKKNPSLVEIATDSFLLNRFCKRA